jgi:hypothetical protein
LNYAAAVRTRAWAVAAFLSIAGCKKTVVKEEGVVQPLPRHRSPVVELTPPAPSRRERPAPDGGPWLLAPVQRGPLPPPTAVAILDEDIGRVETPPALQALGLRVLGFDTEADIPPHHADLALRLGSLCGEVLADARFAQQPGDLAHGYALDAWIGDLHLRTVARPVEDEWYDVGAVVGLVNQLAIGAGRACRLAVIAPDGQEAFVAGGSPETLRSAIDQGLVISSLSARDVDEAGRLGRAVE